MFKLRTLAAATLAFAAAGAFAQAASAPAATPGVDQRQANQEQRIDQGIASGDDPVNDPLLGATKIRIAEDPAQQVEGTGCRRWGHRLGPCLISGGRACGPGPW